MMTWNLRRAEGAADWRARLPGIAAVLAQEEPDILCVQEALPPMLADLRALLPRHVLVPGVEGVNGERNGIFVDTLRYDIEDAGGLWLSDTPHAPHSISWGNKAPRTATWATLRDRRTGETRTYVNTHLDDLSSEARWRSAKLLRERFADAILAGDFNAMPEGSVHDLLTRDWRDPLPDRGAPTLPGRDGGPPARLDWILLPHDVPYTDARVVDFPAGPRASDHLPLAVELSPRRADEPPAQE